MLAYLVSIWDCRYFWLALVHCDLRSRYRGSVLGMGWSMLHPVAMTVILCLVFHAMFKMEISVFAPFLLSGLALWTFVHTCAMSGTGCFFQNEAYIRQFPAPMAIYPLRTALGAGFNGLLALLVSLVAAAYFLGVPGLLPLLSLIPTMLLILLFGWSVAVIFGLANVFFRDTKHLAEVGFQGLFYLTPIMYPLEQFATRTKLLWVLKLNPLTTLLDLIRQPILHNSVPSLASFQLGCLVVLGTVCVASLLLARQERRIIFSL